MSKAGARYDEENVGFTGNQGFVNHSMDAIHIDDLEFVFERDGRIMSGFRVLRGNGLISGRHLQHLLFVM